MGPQIETSAPSWVFLVKNEEGNEGNSVHVILAIITYDRDRDLSTTMALSTTMGPQHHHGGTEGPQDDNPYCVSFYFSPDNWDILGQCGMGGGGGRFRGNSSFSLRPRMNSDFNAFSSISVSQVYRGGGGGGGHYVQKWIFRVPHIPKYHYFSKPWNKYFLIFDQTYSFKHFIYGDTSMDILWNKLYFS